MNKSRSNNIVIFLLCLCLAGCAASLNDVREDEPKAEYTSNKSVKTLGECILYGWQEHTSGFYDYGETFMQPYQENGLTVFSGGRLEVSDIVAKNGKSHVTFYYRGGLLRGRINKRLEVIESCIPLITG